MPSEDFKQSAGSQIPLLDRSIPKSEFLIEVPADSELKFHAENIKRLMIEGMKQVVPDLLVGVSYSATDRWWKEAAAIYDASGNQLLIWQPAPKSAA
jgi:hypothetical protein